ncbi:UNVERIFIED_CONTAM: glyoxylase-like metal-dependent hydrolase (beta-lactamase superfamily II) [Brevibacillus sp. OAP136]
MSDQQLQHLTDSVAYLPADHETDRPILAAISGKDRTLVLDAGNSPAHARFFLTQVAKLDRPRPELVAITHWHWDHVFGMKEMGLPSIAHHETKTMLQRLLPYDWSDEALAHRVEQGSEIPFCADMIKKEFPPAIRGEIAIVLPTITFADQIEIELGGITCRMDHVGGDHAHDSAVLYVEQERVLFLGDALAPDIYTTERNYTTAGFLALLERIAAYPAEWYVESHGTPLPRAQFWQEMDEMRAVALLTEQCHGAREEIMERLPENIGRALREDDAQLVQYFISGWKKNRS